MKQQGIALVVTLMILVVVGVLVFGASFTAMVEQWVTRNDRTATVAFYVAEAGLQEAKTRLFQSYRYALVRAVGSGNSLPSRSECSNPLAAGIDWNRDGVIEDTATYSEKLPFTYTATLPLGEAQGRYTVTIDTDPTRPRFMVVRSVGVFAGARSTVQATVELSNTGPWNYAIFSGAGAANQHLNGGATIRGGLYVVGDPNAPEKVVIDARGDFSMKNGYDLTGPGYGGVHTRVNPEMRRLDNLCATLRVQYGRVEVGGSAQYGEPTNRLLGAYVGDEEADIFGSAAGVCTNTKGVCADDRGVFDLDPNLAPRFPTFDGTRCSTDRNLTWRQCIQKEAEAQGLRIMPGNLRYPGGALLNDPGGCATFLSQSATAGAIVLDQDPVDCTYSLSGYNPAGGFRYDPTRNPPRLEVYGTLEIVGLDLKLVGRGRTIEYRAYSFAQRGKNAAIVVERDPISGAGGSILIGDSSANVSLLPDTTYATFPNQVLALLAEREVHQIRKTQPSHVMAVIYAGQRFRTQKDNVTYGTIVTNEFCTTSAGGNNCNAGQKAEVVYIPTLQNLPAAARYPESTLAASFQITSYERR
ncbi:pilus assembly PilX family protein [Marinithermus hydrothermalis]|uniref:Type 4 fimbrial biogenesis protein PilX N-terminal domain-containing protein n=1 Tax=Marinithermus hydrothermalis (strain DSM 14884 / JCM 11576 / T1) TaxID=869210 RepID=F2NL45_MARHT|nr:pilus assembly PilX N-terminal domain-containing protein [Marinithermus hydrothermalis]AEB11448.1 hypothetical protein Marky_0698 [Marinithermus hydrothermalis DSM 14884]